MMKTLYSTITHNFSEKAIFKIPLSIDQFVYMSVVLHDNNESDDCVLVVDAMKFLSLWGADPYNTEAQLSRGNKEDWMNDYKYHYAVKGFSYGLDNPVPLAEVVCQQHISHRPIYKKSSFWRRKTFGYKEMHSSYVGFINGITRTIWLLANDALLFPVRCRLKDGMDLLEQGCAVEGETPVMVRDIKRQFSQ